MSKLAEKLSRLLALATLREGEEGDEARKNEARTAAFVLLQTCQQEGVGIRFKLPPEREPARVRGGAAGKAPNVPQHGDQDWEAFFEACLRGSRHDRAKPARPKQEGGRRGAYAWRDQADTARAWQDQGDFGGDTTRRPHVTSQTPPAHVVQEYGNGSECCAACFKPIAASEMMWGNLNNRLHAHARCGWQAIV